MKHKYTNRLSKEKSPYLLQHANNPVDWFAWTEEAFEKAEKENKPVFLSIGYSTCHWCHVMESESFEDEEIAGYLNKNFVSIKLDREERPDLDAIYMSACQYLTGGGGWPLTLFLTPDRKPFFAGTYFPKESQWGKIGFSELTKKIIELWNNDREKLISSSEHVVRNLQSDYKYESGFTLGQRTFQAAFEALQSTFDDVHGGFNHSPKFPMANNFSLLLRYYKLSGNRKALNMAEKTLTEMRLGGIYDHIGFGFHRYSTDEKWLVPHFEKMLYDQAILACAYIEAFQVTGNELYSKTAQEILTYVLRDMTAPEGGFYTAEDADSEGKEGKFYLWKMKEVRQVLKIRNVEFAKAYNMRPEGNFTDPLHPYLNLENIPHLKNPELVSSFATDKKKMFQYRESRVHPLKDDKILVDWNGLMISAFAKAYQVFSDKTYLKAAENAVLFIQKNLADGEGLFHRYCKGEAAFVANLDDYSFFIKGLIDLYEAGFDPEHLRYAIQLTNYVIKHFSVEDGGFYFTSDLAENLITRKIDVYDGAIPSGNSAMLYNLIKLSRITDNKEFSSLVDKMNSNFSSKVAWVPSAYTQYLSSYYMLHSKPVEIVIVTGKNQKYTSKIIRELSGRFLPNKIIIVKDKDSDIYDIAAFTSNFTTIQSKTAIYICKDHSCALPVTDIESALKLIEAD